MLRRLPEYPPNCPNFSIINASCHPLFSLRSNSTPLECGSVDTPFSIDISPLRGGESARKPYWNAQNLLVATWVIITKLWTIFLGFLCDRLNSTEHFRYPYKIFYIPVAPLGLGSWQRHRFYTRVAPLGLLSADTEYYFLRVVFEK